MKTLRVIFLVIVAQLFGAFAGAAVLSSSAGCSGAGVYMRELDTINDPADDTTLRKCRQEMRAAQDAGTASTPVAAKKVYVDCTVDGGLR